MRRYGPVVYTIASALLLLAFWPTLWMCAVAGSALGFAFGHLMFAGRLRRFEGAE